MAGDLTPPITPRPGGPDPTWLRASRAHVTGLTGRYRQAVVDYTGEDHKRINGWLRAGVTVSDAWAAARAEDLDAVLEVNPLAAPTTLTRIVSLSQAFKRAGGEGLTKIAGLQRVERGFLSTSRKTSFSMKKITDPVVLDVLAPTGTPAAAIEDLSKAPNQFEVLLGRGLQYVIVEPFRDEKNGVWRASMIIYRNRKG